MPRDEKAFCLDLKDLSGGGEPLIHVTTLHRASLGYREHIGKDSLLAAKKARQDIDLSYMLLFTHVDLSHSLAVDQ